MVVLPYVLDEADGVVTKSICFQHLVCLIKHQDDHVAEVHQAPCLPHLEPTVCGHEHL